MCVESSFGTRLSTCMTPCMYVTAKCSKAREIEISFLWPLVAMYIYHTYLWYIPFSERSGRHRLQQRMWALWLRARSLASLGEGEVHGLLRAAGEAKGRVRQVLRRRHIEKGPPPHRAYRISLARQVTLQGQISSLICLKKRIRGSCSLSLILRNCG